MPITPLPTDTVRLLRAHVVISTPLSVVKELVDNSIDAGAAAIEVLISPNTLDRIEVRDNGRGIDTRDLEALGRRGHTSKLRSFQELGSLGGSSLGFRGEAIAAMCSVAKVTVTTRTVGELMATSFDLVADGKDSPKTTKKPTPVGTTIVVSAMFDRLPVRKKVAVKEAKSTMVKIKQLLTAYALARPRLKLCLKELGTSLPNWSYSPRPAATIKDAAMSLFGLELAAQCVVSSLDGPRTRDQDAASECSANIVQVEAFLPKPDAFVSKIASKDAHFSVDSRPMSSSKGTFKKIYAHFKKVVGKSVAAAGDKRRFKDPFLALNITCPTGSYDVNLESAKDNVLFADEEAVASLCNSLFEKLYGVAETAQAPHVHEKHGDVAKAPGGTVQVVSGLEDFVSSQSDMPKQSDFQVISRASAANNIPTSNSQLISPENQLTIDDGGPLQPLHSCSIGKLPRWSVNMDMGDKTDEEDSSPRGRSDEVRPADSSLPTSPISSDGQTMSRPLDGVNPWMIAKMNAAVRHAQVPRPVQPAQAAQESASTEHSRHAVSPVRSAPNSLVPPQVLWDNPAGADLRIPRPQVPPVGDLDFVGSQSPIQRIAQPRTLVLVGAFRTPLPSGGRSGARRTTARQQRQPLSWLENGQTIPPSSFEASQQTDNNKRTIKRQNLGYGGPLRQARLHFPDQNRRKYKRQARSENYASDSDTVIECDVPATNVDIHDEPRATPSSTAPRHSREEPVCDTTPQAKITAARAVLRQIRRSEEPRGDDDSDPSEEESREDLIGLQGHHSRSMSDAQARRLKSSKLPLETPTGETLCLVEWLENYEINRPRAIETRLSDVDSYVASGTIGEGLRLDGGAVSNADELEKRIKVLLGQIVKASGEKGAGFDVDVDLRRAVAGVPRRCKRAVR